MGDRPEFIQKATEWFKLLQDAAPPDVPLLFGIISGALLSIAVSPGGRIADFIKSVKAAPPWLNEQVWWRGMLIIAAILIVAVYLIWRGTERRRIDKIAGRILGARVCFTVGIGTQSAHAQKKCAITLRPTIFTDKHHPMPPKLILCSRCNQTSIELLLTRDGDGPLYRGTCDERDFHDDVIFTMSANRSDNHAVVQFRGNHFALIEIRNADGNSECEAMAICNNFTLQHDPIRDGALAVP